MSEILHIACTKIDENYTLQNLKFFQGVIEFLLTLRARCPSIFISIAIELNVPRDEFSSIAIEPNVSVALKRGFKKAGSVLSDIGDSWDKDFLMRLHQSIFT